MRQILLMWDATADLTPGKTLMAVSIWGYSSSSDKGWVSYIDNVAVMSLK